MFQKGNKIAIGNKPNKTSFKKSIHYSLKTQFQKGQVSPMEGKHHTKEAKEKMRLKRLGKKGWNKGITKKEDNRIAQPWLGKKRPEMSGENHPFWKGGISTEQDKLRHSVEINWWKKVCMERDNFTDQKTGISGGRLVVHHINNFADFPEFRTSIENGITLSEKTHKKFHHIYGYKNNTKEQLLEFIIQRSVN